MSTHAVTLELQGFGTTSGTVTLSEHSFEQRLARAASALLLVWLFAFIAVFIPLLHFVLVPALVLGGPVIATLRFREDVSLKEVRGACPRCKEERTFEGSGRFRDGRSFHCDGCGRSITLRLQSDSSSASSA